MIDNDGVLSLRLGARQLSLTAAETAELRAFLDATRHYTEGLSMALTDLTVRNAKPLGNKQQKLFDEARPVFACYPAGESEWQLKYRFGVRRRACRWASIRTLV
jgi:hypothetical protein